MSYWRVSEPYRIIVPWLNLVGHPATWEIEAGGEDSKACLSYTANSRQLSQLSKSLLQNTK